MCDSFVAMPDVTADGRVLFAKNSDRERNEAQFLELVPRQRHEPGSRLRTTYIDIPQVAETHAVLLSRPFWLWGAEMGANEHGVVIGNEAMFSTVKAERRRALIGMDLVRLGLERARTAAEAAAIITSLLERHGQGGDCGHLHRFYYHNGFLIADGREAFVLETVGRWWIVEAVTHSRALSNALSIGTGTASAALRAHAEAEGWLDNDGRFDFAERLIDPERDAASFARGRCARGTELLARGAGRLDRAAMMAILRDHGASAEGDPAWEPARTEGRTICMHAADGARRSQTTAAMVSEFRDETMLHWVTGSSAPCTSLFKPILLEAGLPRQGVRPTDRFDPGASWWRHECLHRAVLKDYAAAMAEIAPERDAAERGFGERMDQALASGDPKLAKAAITACWREAEALEERWRSSLAGRRPSRPGGAYGRSWTRLSLRAGLPSAVGETAHELTAAAP